MKAAENFAEEQIAATLNRLGLKTGGGHTWNAGRLRSIRGDYELPAYNATDTPCQTITWKERPEAFGDKPQKSHTSTDRAEQNTVSKSFRGRRRERSKLVSNRRQSGRR